VAFLIVPEADWPWAGRSSPSFCAWRSVSRTVAGLGNVRARSRSHPSPRKPHANVIDLSSALGNVWVGRNRIGSNRSLFGHSQKYLASRHFDFADKRANKTLVND